MEYIFKVSGAVWIFGAFFLIISSVIVYNLTATRLNKGESVKNNDVLERLKVRLNINKDVHLYESAFVKSPVVAGIMNPKIIIPKDISKEALEYALLHELCHIKYCDNLWRLISVFAACIHWFNPFAWIFLYISGQDMELACDERVMKGMTGDERKSYANALLTLAARQQGFLTAFGSKSESNEYSII